MYGVCLHAGQWQCLSGTDHLVVQVDLLHLPQHIQADAHRLAYMGFLLLELNCFSFISHLHEEYFRYHHYKYQYHDVAEMLDTSFFTK